VETMAMGRPKKTIDLVELKKLCEMQCTAHEICGFFGIHEETLNRIVKDEYGITFPEYFEQSRCTGKAALRRRQFQTAMDGNPTMLIWLGKNWLGQVDKQEITQHSDTVVKVKITDTTDD
jgi:hypothetical protein